MTPPLRLRSAPPLTKGRQIALTPWPPLPEHTAYNKHHSKINEIFINNLNYLRGEGEK